MPAETAVADGAAGARPEGAEKAETMAAEVVRAAQGKVVMPEVAPQVVKATREAEAQEEAETAVAAPEAEATELQSITSEFKSML